MCQPGLPKFDRSPLSESAIEAESQAPYYEVQASWWPPLMRSAPLSKFPDLNFLPDSRDDPKYRHSATAGRTGSPSRTHCCRHPTNVEAAAPSTTMAYVPRAPTRLRVVLAGLLAGAVLGSVRLLTAGNGPPSSPMLERLTISVVSGLLYGAVLAPLAMRLPPRRW